MYLLLTLPMRDVSLSLSEEDDRTAQAHRTSHSTNFPPCRTSSLKKSSSLTKRACH